MILFCTFLVTRSHRRNAGTSNPCSEPTNPRYQKQLLLVVSTRYIPLKSLKIRPNACAWVALQVVPKSSPLGLGNVHAARLSAPSYFSSYPWLHRKIRPILFQFGSYKKNGNHHFLKTLNHLLAYHWHPKTKLFGSNTTIDIHQFKEKELVPWNRRLVRAPSQFSFRKASDLVEEVGVTDPVGKNRKSEGL